MTGAGRTRWSRRYGATALRVVRVSPPNVIFVACVSLLASPPNLNFAPVCILHPYAGLVLEYAGMLGWRLEYCCIIMLLDSVRVPRT